jgi:uncharacterized protein with HEPN domain
VKEDRLYLVHMQECITRIEAYTAGGEDAFFAETIVQDAVLRNLQTLAESAQRLSDALKLAHPDVDWQAISGFRNVLVHDYLGINLRRVWEIVSRDLPTLRNKVCALLRGKGE